LIIPENIEGELKPIIVHRLGPVLFRTGCRPDKHPLKCQSDDYSTPEGISFNNISLRSNPIDNGKFQFIHGLCLQAIENGFDT